MDRTATWLLILPIVFLLIPGLNSEDQIVKESLVQFMERLSPGNAKREANWGWNLTSDPCNDEWKGVRCNMATRTVKRIVLDELNLNGTLDADSLCKAKALVFLGLKNNNMVGAVPEEIGNCKHLTHLYLSGNKFSGQLPASMSKLSKLVMIDVSDNNFTGKLPNLPRGMLSFLAQNNHFTGSLPEFDYAKLVEFNVSNNEFSGPVPDMKGRFEVDSFLGNPGLCGEPLLNKCPQSLESNESSKKWSVDRFLVYLGYAFLGLLVVVFIVVRLVTKMRSKGKVDGVEKLRKMDSSSSSKFYENSIELMAEENKSEHSTTMTSMESVIAPPSLVVLAGPSLRDMKFEELLQSPAELLGRGKNGTLYKVELSDGARLAVKRIGGSGISEEDFKRRMLKLDLVKHPNVISAVAFYCTKHEKLLVYEYQPNGSLFKLLHGSQNGQVFDWESRLAAAAVTAEALAFMHKELHDDGIAHGNIKSTNILFNQNMEPCISEYGITLIQNQDSPALPRNRSSSKVNSLPENQGNGSFASDVCGFGVILLELLTGKMVKNAGMDLTKWVDSVVREEWTAEVFDRNLLAEGVNEERLVNLLQLALKCVSPSPNERPSMAEVSAMMNKIKEEDERSIALSFEP